MDNGAGLNGPVMALTFLSGLGLTSITNLLASLLSAILIGLIGLAANTLLKGWIADRNNLWRKRAKELEAANRQLTAQLKEQGTDAAQLPARSN